MSYYTDDRDYIYSSDVEYKTYRFRVAYDAETHQPFPTRGWVLSAYSEKLVPRDLYTTEKTWASCIRGSQVFREQIDQMHLDFMRQVGASEEEQQSAPLYSKTLRHARNHVPSPATYDRIRKTSPAVPLPEWTVKNPQSGDTDGATE